jgi:ATP-binding cassette, subfamily B, bacterial MsbA
MKTASNSGKNIFQALRRIFSYAWPYRWRLLVAMLASVLGSLLWLAIPLGLRELIDAVFEQGDRQLLNLLTFGLIILFVMQSVLGFAGSYILDWIGERIITDLRMNLYRHLHRLGLRFYSGQRLGEITSRLTNDVASIRNAATGTLAEALTQTIGLVGSVGLMVMLNWRLSLVIFVTVPVISLATRYFGSKIRTLSRLVQDRLADTTAVAEETLGAIRAVKSFARESYEIQRYNDSTETLFHTARRRVLLSNLFWSSVGIVFMMTMILIFWFGGTEVLAGRLTAGDLVAFIFYAFNIARSVGGMSRIYTTFNTAAGASERIFDLLDQVPEIDDHPDSEELPVISGTIEFRGVSFAYDTGQPILQNISLLASPGEVIALVGPSGAGKTTLLNLLPRFYDVDSGAIFIDGYDIRQVTQKSLRNQIAVVPQDVHLFGTTILENIRYGRLDASPDEVIEAAKAAQAHDFIMESANGYESLVGERGVKLSGGQRQRIAIARAILKNPKILLLDEATSSLDSESEAAVQEALDQLMKSRTSFVIAHRLSTVRNASRILVLDKGRIAEQGDHETLIKADGLYRRLYDIQFKQVQMSPDLTVTEPGLHS